MSRGPHVNNGENEDKINFFRKIGSPKPDSRPSRSDLLDQNRIKEHVGHLDRCHGHPDTQ